MGSKKKAVKRKPAKKSTKKKPVKKRAPKVVAPPKPLSPEAEYEGDGQLDMLDSHDDLEDEGREVSAAQREDPLWDPQP
jgi:hypothetical protein